MVRFLPQEEGSVQRSLSCEDSLSSQEERAQIRAKGRERSDLGRTPLSEVQPEIRCRLDLCSRRASLLAAEKEARQGGSLTFCDGGQCYCKKDDCFCYTTKGGRCDLCETRGCLRGVREEKAGEDKGLFPTIEIASERGQGRRRIADLGAWSGSLGTFTTKEGTFFFHKSQMGNGGEDLKAGRKVSFLPARRGKGKTYEAVRIVSELEEGEKRKRKGSRLLSEFAFSSFEELTKFIAMEDAEENSLKLLCSHEALTELTKSLRKVKSMIRENEKRHAPPAVAKFSLQEKESFGPVQKNAALRSLLAEEFQLQEKEGAERSEGIAARPGEESPREEEGLEGVDPRLKGSSPREEFLGLFLESPSLRQEHLGREGARLELVRQLALFVIVARGRQGQAEMPYWTRDYRREGFGYKGEAGFWEGGLLERAKDRLTRARVDLGCDQAKGGRSAKEEPKVYFRAPPHTSREEIEGLLGEAGTVVRLSMRKRKRGDEIGTCVFSTFEEAIESQGLSQKGGIELSGKARRGGSQRTGRLCGNKYCQNSISGIKGRVCKICKGGDLRNLTGCQALVVRLERLGPIPRDKEPKERFEGGSGRVTLLYASAAEAYEAAEVLEPHATFRHLGCRREAESLLRGEITRDHYLALSEMSMEPKSLLGIEFRFAQLALSVSKGRSCQLAKS